MALFLAVDFNTPGAVDTAGVRPYTGTNPQWNNTSIFLDGGVDQTRTRIDAPTTIKVRVSNASATAIEDVHVDAYVMNPFVGPFQPFNARRKLTGFAASIGAGSGTTSPADAHVITCMIQDPVQGAIPWKPTAADIAGTSDGHLCLVANAYSVPDGGPVPDTTTYDVINDPHQGQRNIAVLPALAIRKFQFQVFGPEDGGEFALDVHRLTARDLGAGERWLLRSLRQVTIPREGRKRLVLAGTRGRPDVPIGMSRRAVRGTLTIDGVGEHDLHELTRIGSVVQPMLARQPLREARDWGAGRLVTSVGRDPVFAHLAIQPTGRPGGLQALDIVMRDAVGRPIGGLRILSLQR
jgi:hypothetical protein